MWGVCTLPGLKGRRALSGRFAVNGTDGENCGEGAREAGMGSADATLWSSPPSGKAGMGGAGFASTTRGRLGGFDIDGEASCRLESGGDSLIGDI